MDVLNLLEPWHWLILAFLLLAAEALGAGGFLLGSAAAALLIAAISWMLPALGWAGQFVIFALFSLVLTIAYWKMFRKVNNQSDHPELNNRASQLIGRVFELDQDIPGGQGKAQIGDTLWKVQSNKTLLKGTQVVVVSCQGMVLFIEEQNTRI